MNFRRFAAIAFAAMLFVPATAMAQYRDLDSAMSGLTRGFERGDAQPIVEGVGAGDKVMLDFPGLIRESGFFGKDQASYLLDEVFTHALHDPVETDARLPARRSRRQRDFVVREVSRSELQPQRHALQLPLRGAAPERHVGAVVEVHAHPSGA